MEKEVKVDIPESKDVKEEKKVEKKVGERADRKREQVSSLLNDHYDLKVGEALTKESLTKLVDREMASAESFNKIIKQKINYRDNHPKLQKEEKETDSQVENPNKENKNSFDKLRGIERTKAAQVFMQELVDKYPEKFKSKEDVSDAYEQIKKESNEDGNETTREDFKGVLSKAFKVSFPDLYEDEIKAIERKRLLEDDVDIDNIVNEQKGEKKKKKEMIFFKPKMSKEKTVDWLIGKD